jgi:aminoglycoside phosphotransferase (APT) family kinase protein
MEFLITELPARLPRDAEAAGGTCLVHGDYRLDNLIIREPVTTAGSGSSSIGGGGGGIGGGMVAAVLDWELATLGDRMSDVAYNCMAYQLDASFPLLPGTNARAVAGASYLRGSSRSRPAVYLRTVFCRWIKRNDLELLPNPRCFFFKIHCVLSFVSRFTWAASR